MLVALLLAATAGAYVYGVYSTAYNSWPLESLHKLKSIVRPPPKLLGTYDRNGRLTTYPGKTAVDCPDQTKDTAVLLAAGQSNSANDGQRKFTTRYPAQAFNYFDGKCYVASSPLLGASAEGGEFLTLLADELISSGTYKSVIILSSGIGATAISRWQRDGDLNDMLLATVKAMAGKYKVTEVIWHQGESDFMNVTSTKNYVAAFNSLLQTLAEVDVVAPVYIAIASKCAANWVPDNPVVRAQRQLIDNRKIHLGADTDALVAANDRRDGCHFGESGQLKTAMAYAVAIRKSRRTN